MVSNKRLYIIGVCVFICAIVGTLAFYMFAPVSKSSEIEYLYIDNDDDIDSLSMKISEKCHDWGKSAIITMARHTEYYNHVRPGRYEITPSMGSFVLFRHLRNGHQSAIKLIVPSITTKERLAEVLSMKLMIGEEDLLDYFESNDSCQLFGKDTATVVCLFVPNTYEVYWNISAKKLITKMQDESKAFWNGTRAAKAEQLGLSTDEVMTLASIVDEETANNGEKPMIAGMYYNRLQKGMPLQADPTVKFALKQFELRRIYTNMLRTPSPYNTYINTGLPPGPIRVPSVAGIDAVLDMVKHDYLYMCAKEDFSGTHNFAVTYAEHLKNAAKYSAALNARNIK